MEINTKRLFDDLMQLGYMHKPKDSSESRFKDSYYHIPYSYNALAGNLQIIKDHSKKSYLSFIDYGCGPGFTLLVARALDFYTTGVEFDKKLFYFCKRMLPNSNILQADLTTHLFAIGYYDVVYFYCPFRDEEKEIKFEKKALMSIKIGGYLIAPPPARLTYERSVERVCKNFKSKFKFINESTYQRIS
jgi:hypothetical protein